MSNSSEGSAGNISIRKLETSSRSQSARKKTLASKKVKTTFRLPAASYDKLMEIANGLSKPHARVWQNSIIEYAIDFLHRAYRKGQLEGLDQVLAVDVSEAIKEGIAAKKQDTEEGAN